MKKLAFGLLALGLIAGDVSEASAAACAAGPYRAGCVGPRGAVVAHRPYPYYRPYPYARPVYRPYCYWRAGVRICR